MARAKKNKGILEILLLNIPSYPAEINERQNRMRHSTCEHLAPRLDDRFS